MISRPTVRLALGLALGALVAGTGHAGASRNLLANAGFELGGSGPWRMDKGGGTVGRFEVRGDRAYEGQRSALVTIEKVEEWGTQFGQTLSAGARGKTHTFAVLAKAVGKPVTVDLQIERSARPWDRAARSGQFTLRPDQWTELHVTFKVEKDFPEGWFAYISCTQPNAQYRADAFRLYEGDYVPYAKAAQDATEAVAVHLFDTGAPSPGPIAEDAFATRKGWTQVPKDTTEHRFRGDAVFLNSRVAVVLRRRGRGAELYSLRAAAATTRAVLAPVPSPAELSSLAIAENSLATVAMDATFRTAAGRPAAVRWELSLGQPYVKTEPRAGSEALRVEAPCRFAVLPDFFADDIVVDATELPGAEAELPSEHFLLHLLGDGDAIVMAAWNVRGDDIRMTLSGAGERRAFAASTIPFARKGSIWVAVLDGPGVWHRHDIAAGDAGRIIRLDWTRPFPAQWRVDWTRDDGLGDSWEMADEQPSGKFLKHGWFGSPNTLPPNRSRWTTVLGRFAYPCWLDRSGRGWLQPLRSKALRFQGPAIVYPINRVAATPLDAFTIVDIVRGTLGVGPCEYILDVEGQQSHYKGRATCATRDTLNAIYGKKQQKERRAEIERALDEVTVFIRHIRGRIESYVAFGHAIRAYLADARQAQPELAEPLGELDKLAAMIDQRVAARRDTIKTPAHAAAMVEEFRRTLLGYEADDALARCKQFTKAWVEIGGSQDELVGECRWAVKMLRQRAALAMARDPRLAKVAREIRERAQKVLRNPASHEGARH